MPLKKWRPSFRCSYVIPEIKGNIESLELMLDRLLPLRKWAGQEDDLIFLGGYIDGFKDGGKVIETLITIKNEYGDRVTCLMGATEHRLLRALDGSQRDYQDWIIAGGVETIRGYLEVAEVNSDPATFPQNRLQDIVPKHHIDFLRSLPYSYQIDEYLFVYGGLNWKVPIAENNDITFAMDTVANREYKNRYLKKEVFVEKVVVASYSSLGEPEIYPGYFMLGGQAPRKLITLDINSMESVAVKIGKKKIYPTKIRAYE